MFSQNPQAEQGLAEQLAALGRFLQNVRQEQHLSYEDVAAKTHIPVRILKALEFADVKQLPEPVYIQGFLRRYAEALSIDPSQARLSFYHRPQEKKSPSIFTILGFPQLRPLHLYLFYTVLVITAVTSLSRLLSQPFYQQQMGVSQPTSLLIPAPPSNQSSHLSSTRENPEKESTDRQNLIAKERSGKSVRVEVKLVSQSWLRVVADGKMQYEGVLQEGAQQSWEADQQIVLRAGNAGGVVVTLNDGTPKPLGQAGSVEEVIYGAASSSADLSNMNLQAEPTATL